MAHFKSTLTTSIIRQFSEIKCFTQLLPFPSTMLAYLPRSFASCAVWEVLTLSPRFIVHRTHRFHGFAYSYVFMRNIRRNLRQCDLWIILLLFYPPRDVSLWCRSVVWISGNFPCYLFRTLNVSLQCFSIFGQTKMPLILSPTSIMHTAGNCEWAEDSSSKQEFRVFQLLGTRTWIYDPSIKTELQRNQWGKVCNEYYNQFPEAPNLRPPTDSITRWCLETRTTDDQERLDTRLGECKPLDSHNVTPQFHVLVPGVGTALVRTQIFSVVLHWSTCNDTMLREKSF